MYNQLPAQQWLKIIMVEGQELEDYIETSTIQIHDFCCRRLMVNIMRLMGLLLRLMVNIGLMGLPLRQNVRLRD